MPFYEYECQACKFYTEVMQKISDPPLGKCPSCGKKQLKKLVSAPVFRLKGGGWYETDFKSDQESKRNLLGAEKEEPKADKGEKEVKADAKDAKEPKEAKAAEAKGTTAKSTPATKSAPARRASRRATRAAPRRRGKGGR
jgi:putative FmdB family regulatory protein